MTCWKCDGSQFIKDYPTQPAIAIQSIKEMKEMFAKDEHLVFYYPCIPCKDRDENTLDILEHFTNSVMLTEKPSHANRTTAVEFKKALEERNIDQRRLIVGMHSFLHPARKAMEKFLKENLHKYEIIGVEAYNHYPKDPTNPRDGRCFRKDIGGVLLDLGVYVYQQADEIARYIGFDIKEALSNASKKTIALKNNPDGIDIE